MKQKPLLAAMAAVLAAHSAFASEPTRRLNQSALEPSALVAPTTWQYRAGCLWQCDGPKDTQCRQISCDITVTASSKSDADGKARLALEAQAKATYGPGHFSGQVSLQLVWSQ